VQLKDRLFLNLWVAEISKQAQACIVVFELDSKNVVDYKFAGKKIAAHLSEALVPTIAVNANQKGIWTYDSNHQLMCNINAIDRLFQQVKCVVLAPLAENQGIVKPVGVSEYLPMLRAMSTHKPIHLFSNNDRSPLANPPTQISSLEQMNNLLDLYPEESAVITLAREILPCQISGPNNFKPE